MGLLDRFLGRSTRDTRAMFDASRLSRRLKGWTAEKKSINTLITTGGDTLRARARQLCRENPYASSAVETFASYAVGTGIKPGSLIEEKALREEVQKLWRKWTDQADADGLTDFYGLEALAARAMFEAGEVFFRIRARRANDGLVVPFQLQALESEMLPYNHNEDLPGGRKIRAGIEFDAIGRRRAYHFLRQHPGEFGAGLGTQKTIVPASEVLHVYRPTRPGQIRGVPALVPSMVRVFLLDQIDDAQMDRQRVAAMFAGFITKPAPESADPVPIEEKDGATGVAPLEPGTMQVLLPGEEVTFSQPAEVANGYESFQYRTLLAICAGLGLPYHSLTADTSKSNYSSSRSAQVDLRRRMEQFQHMTLVFQFCRPVWERFWEDAVLSGALSINAGRFNRERDELMGVRWIPPRWEWVDPLKDRKAEKMAVDERWKSRSDVIEAEGYDPEETDKRIQQDQERAKELGIEKAALATPPEGDEETTEENEPAGGNRTAAA